jgi:hypothetical protein
MTNPRTPKAAANPPKDQDELLRQLVRLADSVQALAEKPPPPPPPPTTPPPTTPPTTTPTPAETERDKVVFAYTFLGELLVRGVLNADLLSGSRVSTPRVEVIRNADGLTFPVLNEANAARVQAGRTVVLLENLQVNTAVRPSGIEDDQLIDSIILLRDGVPVAIALCVDVDIVDVR